MPAIIFVAKEEDPVEQQVDHVEEEDPAAAGPFLC